MHITFILLYNLQLRFEPMTFLLYEGNTPIIRGISSSNYACGAGVVGSGGTGGAGGTGVCVGSDMTLSAS